LVAWQDWRDSKKPTMAVTGGKANNRQEKIKVKA